MVTRAPKPAAIGAAVLFILASVALTLFAWRSLGGGLPFAPAGYRFHVSFANASQLAPNAAVRIAGVDVGKVISVRRAGLRTDATIELRTRYAPLASDARATLREKTLLGETFVALTPGTRGAPKVREGGRLRTRQVEATQPLDRVLGTLDPATRRNVTALFTGGATALQNRGDDLNAALGNLDPVARQLATISALLDHQRGDVAALVRDSGSVLRTVAARRAAVQRLVRAGDDVLSATAEQDDAVTGTVRALPGLLAQLRATSSAVVRTSEVAAPTLRAVRPVAPLVRPALVSFERLAPPARAVLSELDHALPVARRALPAMGRLLRALVPFTRVLEPATREITPIIGLIASYRGELVATAANVAAATEATSPGVDGRPVHYLRTLVPFTDESIVGYDKRLASNRHNAYFAPGGLGRLASGLLASDCRNTGNAQPVPVLGTGAPSCRQQGPWSYGGARRYYPHVQRTPAR